MITFAEYIWLDGCKPTQKLRSKSRVVELKGIQDVNLAGPDDLPVWNFDGSSTEQAPGDDSECVLQPIAVRLDPMRFMGPNSVMVLCEVMNMDGTPHESNQRAKLRKTLDGGGVELETLWGFEQEHCLLNNKTDAMLGWPASTKHYPKPQGMYYCGVGADEVVGRDMVYEHARNCLRAGLFLYGTNAEVMLGQWEFQVGYRGFRQDMAIQAGPLLISDDLWFARYLLYRTGEKYDVYATLDPKPREGNWNGSGLHTNISDKYMRSKKDGKARIEAAEVVFKKNHKEHQKVYGYDNRRRSTGLHETAHYDEFSMGVADRGASVRIPNKTDKDGHGYIEDRRPAANADPYVVTNRIITTLLEIEV